MNLDIYRCYLIGWAIFERESEVLAKRLIQTTSRRQRVEPGQLAVHADCGAVMR